MKHKLSLLAAIVMMATTLQAQNFDFSAAAPSGQTLYYKVMDSSTVSVVYPNYSNGDYWSGYTKPSLTLTIPSTVYNDGVTYTVTSVGFNAFYNCANLEAVNMPTTLTSIGDYAFYQCSYIYHIVIPEGVTSIGAYAFYGISLAYDVSLPSTLTYIGERAFYGVSNISELTIPRNVQYIGTYAFATCNLLYTLNYNADSCVFQGGEGSQSGNQSSVVFNAFNTLTELNIGNHVRYIPASAFAGCHFTSVTFPNSLRTIGSHAFENCVNLTSVNWGNGVQKIKNYAFKGCYNVISLNLPNTVKEIGLNSFSNWSITSVTIPNSLEMIRAEAFSNCANLTNLYFNADSCVGFSLEETFPVFYECPHLTTVVFGNNVKSIPPSLCKGLPIMTITIPNSVKVIGSSAFSGCNGLLTANLGDSIERIGHEAFKGCGNLVSITLPSSLKKIGRSSFEDCSTLSSITIPHNVDTVYFEAFYGCRNLRDVYFNADSCTLMGGYYDYRRVFSNCDSLSNIYIGNNVKFIPPYAFCAINTLESITIPNSVRKIGEAAFYACHHLNTVSLGNSLDTIMRYAFYNCDMLSSINLPNSLKVIQESAFASCTSLDSITIPQNVIKFSPFTGCTGLTTVTFNADSCLEGTIGATTSLTTLNIGNNVKYIPSELAHYDSLLTSITIPPSVKKIGSSAFASCKHLNTVVFSDSLENIGAFAFQYCNSLTSITIPRSMNLVGIHAFYNCTNLQTVYYNADSCAAWAGSVNELRKPFVGCSALNTIHIGTDVKYLPHNFLYGCDNVSSIYCTPTTPPSHGYDAFYSWSAFGIPVYVPCNAISDYQTILGWNRFTNYQLMSGNHSINISSADVATGSTEYLNTDCEAGMATFQANPATHYRFVNWSDGNTDNPRSLTLTSDTALVATFEPDTFIVAIVANVDSMGNVAGSGVYYHGDTVRASAFANGRNHFSHWNDNSTINPTVLIINGDTSITAFFSVPPVDTVTIHDTTYTDVFVHDTTYIEVHDTILVTDTLWITQYDTIYIHDTVFVGIDEVESFNAKIYQRDGMIVVESAGTLPVRVFDAVGREAHSSVSRQAAASSPNLGEQLVSIPVPTSGVYLVKIGDYPARRIMVVK